VAGTQDHGERGTHEVGGWRGNLGRNSGVFKNPQKKKVGTSTHTGGKKKKTTKTGGDKERIMINTVKDWEEFFRGGGKMVQKRIN